MSRNEQVEKAGGERYHRESESSSSLHTWHGHRQKLGHYLPPHPSITTAGHQTPPAAGVRAAAYYSICSVIRYAHVYHASNRLQKKW